MCVVLEGAVVAMIVQNFSYLIRKSYGDRVVGNRFKGYAWSALRMLRIVGMDSLDDAEIWMAAEESKRIAAIIEESLGVTSPTSTTGREEHGRCLHSCQRHVELGKIALMLGKKLWVPLINGQYNGTGTSELTLLRTMIPSPQRQHVLFLEFEVASRRATLPSGQVPKVIVELDDEYLSLEEDIAAKGILASEDGDSD